MQMMVAEYLFAVVMCAFVGVWLLFFCIIVLHFIFPKKVLVQYFRSPYFKEFEVQFFSGPLFGLIRTVMFMSICAFPRLGQKRGLTEVYLLVPLWFRLISRVVISFMLFLGVFILSILLGFYLYSQFA